MRMELGLSQHQTLKQIQTLSPQMYMSMEILCLNSLDLEERIETELENNETLEFAERTAKAEETAEASSPEAGTAAAGPAERAATAAEDESFERRFDRWDEYAREEYGGRSQRSYAGDKDEKLEALSNTEGRPMSLQEHLESQVHLLDATEVARLTGPIDEKEEAQVRDLCVDIIYNVDARGYLMYSLEEIAESLEVKPPSSLLQKALKVVQGLDPPGIGGRDLRECLILQLRRDRQDYPIEERIIQDHLSDLGHNRLPKIAKALGIGLEDVKAAAENIASLNPLPGRLFGGDSPQFVKPDVVVEEVEGDYEVRVESDYLPRLQVSSQYRDMYRERRWDKDLRKYLKKKLDSAEWLLAAVRQRQSTLLRISKEIVSIQRGFLDHGISRIKPLKMVDVAERVGVHVSTISRAISGKYMQTPRGVFALKFFFTGGATKTDGTIEARSSVIQRIKDLIANEDRRNPLSDIDIAKKLREWDIHISRRTVTKYREAESIASSRERREY